MRRRQVIQTQRYQDLRRADQRLELGQLCRYINRPLIVNERLIAGY